MSASSCAAIRREGLGAASARRGDVGRAPRRQDDSAPDGPGANLRLRRAAAERGHLGDAGLLTGRLTIRGVGLGFTYVVYRLPPELRWADEERVARAVRAEHPPTDAKVAQWDEHGPGGTEGRPVISKAGYPDSYLVRAESVRDRCPDLDPAEWVLLDAWDLS